MKTKGIQNSTAPTDAELCFAARDGDGDAEEELVRRYTRLVKSCARPYFLIGADAEDTFQEGMLGLLKAIREFDPLRKTLFSAFAQVCITRRIISAMRSASSRKHEPLNYSMSFDRPLFEDLAESRTRGNAPIGDPETLVIGNEERKERMTSLLSVLSEFEARVLKLFLNGYSYEEMSAILQKPQKSVDNAIQRIKRKSAPLNPH